MKNAILFKSMLTRLNPSIMNTPQNLFFLLHSLIKLKKSIRKLYKQNKLEDLLEILTHNFSKNCFQFNY